MVLHSTLSLCTTFAEACNHFEVPHSSGGNILEELNAGKREYSKFANCTSTYLDDGVNKVIISFYDSESLREMCPDDDTLSCSVC